MKKLFQAIKNEPFKTFVIVAAVVALHLLADIRRTQHVIEKKLTSLLNKLEDVKDIIQEQ